MAGAALLKLAGPVAGHGVLSSPLDHCAGVAQWQSNGVPATDAAARLSHSLKAMIASLGGPLIAR